MEKVNQETGEIVNVVIRGPYSGRSKTIAQDAGSQKRLQYERIGKGYKVIGFVDVVKMAQMHERTCNINNILSKYTPEEASALYARNGVYVDVTDVPMSLHEAKEFADDMFNTEQEDKAVKAAESAKAARAKAKADLLAEMAAEAAKAAGGKKEDK